MFLKRVLVGLGVFAGLAAAVDLDPTPMTVNNAQYELHCRAGSDPTYPCFTFIGGDLRDVRAEMYIEGDAVGDNAPTTDFLVKVIRCKVSIFSLTEMACSACRWFGACVTDFTTTDPNKSFSIYWVDFDVSVLYEPIDTSKACYRIQINAPSNGRIWISDAWTAEASILTRETLRWATTTFCSKWLRLHVGNDQ